jgi:hypothetical protein
MKYEDDMQAQVVAVFYPQDQPDLGKSTDTEWGVCSYRGSCLRWGKLKISFVIGNQCIPAKNTLGW